MRGSYLGRHRDRSMTASPKSLAVPLSTAHALKRRPDTDWHAAGQSVFVLSREEG